jgi:geranylgeranyl reductase family protein
MPYDCDVAVVGAGPAGSRTARDLARVGLRVRLIEEHRRVGIPSHCSGLVSPRTLTVSGIGDDAALNRITGAFVHTQSGARVTLGGEETRAVVIDRVALDQTLCDQALTAGADYIRGRVTGVERVNGHVRLNVQTDGRDSSLTARAVVGADGAHSRVARSLGMARPSQFAYNLGAEARIRRDLPTDLWRDDHVHVFVGHDLAPGWFGWIIPAGEGIVRIGIGTSSAVKPIECYRRMAAAWPELFANLEPTRMYGGTIPLTFAPHSSGDRALLVGDAAGQVKPFSGGGIYTSLVAARHAAASLTHAFNSGDLGARSLASYDRGWRKEIGRELRKSWHLRNFGLALSDSQVDRVVTALRAPHLQSLTARHADIDYPSRVLLRLSRSLPALGTLAWAAARRPGATFSLVRAHLPFGA